MQILRPRLRISDSAILEWGPRIYKQHLAPTPDDFDAGGSWIMPLKKKNHCVYKRLAWGILVMKLSCILTLMVVT